MVVWLAHIREEGEEATLFANIGDGPGPCSFYLELVIQLGCPGNVIPLLPGTFDALLQCRYGGICVENAPVFFCCLQKTPGCQTGWRTNKGNQRPVRTNELQIASYGPPLPVQLMPLPTTRSMQGIL